jgi:hypothetical protein
LPHCSNFHCFASKNQIHCNVAKARPFLPWIPEPSTVNNKLKRRKGSGSTGRFFD